MSVARSADRNVGALCVHSLIAMSETEKPQGLRGPARPPVQRRLELCPIDRIACRSFSWPTVYVG